MEGGGNVCPFSENILQVNGVELGQQDVALQGYTNRTICSLTDFGLEESKMSLREDIPAEIKTFFIESQKKLDRRIEA